MCFSEHLFVDALEGFSGNDQYVIWFLYYPYNVVS